MCYLNFFSHKLRRVLRKALLLAEDSFKVKHASKLVKEVSNSVAEVLSSTYPEIGKNLNRVSFICGFFLKLVGTFVFFNFKLKFQILPSI